MALWCLSINKYPTRFLKIYTDFRCFFNNEREKVLFDTQFRSKNTTKLNKVMISFDY